MTWILRVDGHRSTILTKLNTRWHRTALIVFFAIVLSHWAEHVVQAIQIWVLNWPRPRAQGILGLFFPVVITEEWLHWGYAAVMLVGLVLLLPGMTGTARVWWVVALLVQIWHFVEHSILFVQANTGARWFGRPVPTSVLQLVYQRAELHLWYNAIVFVPMVIAMYVHLFPSKRDRAADPTPRCRCAVI